MRKRKPYGKYNKETVKKIVELLESDNYTISEICKAVGIGEATYYEWIKKKPEFLEIIKKARNNFDLAIVKDAERSLVKMVNGYEVQEKRVTMITGRDKKPKIKEQINITKHIAPNVAATIFLLTNRASERWRNNNFSDNRNESEIDTSVFVLPNGKEIEL
ncbi:MAG: hypothetical protein LBR64_02270 [Dysgonamonadaceae bacterium]|jgi:transposase-like protein|nr:hypothetical protein [Dysgonamonadaceae bacterium]